MSHEIKKLGFIPKFGVKRYCKCCGGCCGCRADGCVSGADIAVITMSSALTLASELLCEFLVPHGPQSWMTKALISSGASAFATFLVGFCVYLTNCAQAADGFDSERNCAFYTGLVFSQVLAGAVTFGIGLGMDAATETTIPSHFKGDVVNTIVTPMLVAVARTTVKTVSTGVIGFFKHVCCSKHYPKNYRTPNMLDAEVSSDIDDGLLVVDGDAVQVSPQ